MRIALVVPGGVDRSGEHRVIPALLALIARLARDDEVQVFAMHQQDQFGEWSLAGAHVVNIGLPRTRARAIRAIHRSHRKMPFNIVHAIWSGTCGLVAVVAARLIGRPCVIHVAGGELVAIPQIGYGGMQTWRGRLRERWVLRRAAAVTAASQPILESLAAFGIAGRRVPLGVDRDQWPVRAPRRRCAKRALRLIHVASLNRVKDQTMLLHAMSWLAAAHLSFELNVVGVDTLGGEIQRLCAQLGLTRHITFRGFVTHRTLRFLIEAADLLVMTSRHETGPLAVLEAAMAGVPTVGTAVGHIAEWAACAAAVSVPVGDWQSLAREIGAIAEDENLRLRLAATAQERAICDDADSTARRFRAIYTELTSAAAPR